MSTPTNQASLPVLALLAAATLSGCITPPLRPDDDRGPLIVAGEGVNLATSTPEAAVEAPSEAGEQRANLASGSPQTTGERSTAPPARLPAQVLRIWVAPWEDSAGNLHGASHVFTEILPRRWQLASAHETAASTVLSPLQLEPRQASSPQAQRKH